METDRTSRHPIRSTILGAIAAALATIALVVASSGNNPALAASSVANGSFETGDLTGWTVVVVDKTVSDASAVARYDYCYPSPEGCWEVLSMLPQEGSYFALLKSGYESEATRISQQFEASNGDKVSGWAFFKTENPMYDPYTGANDDKGQVVITSNSGTTVATPFEQSISSVWYGGNSGWRYWEHTFSGLTGVGQFQIEARVQNAGPFRCGGCSVLGLDDVKTSIGGPDTTPPETSITSGPGSSVVTTSTSATFGFSSNEQGSTFKCQLSKDSAVAQAWADCTSPKSYSNLSPASYTFEVRAMDPAGNVDPTPASRIWHINTAPSDTTPSDTTAPKVDSVVPKEDATGVARTTNVTATFSEDMDASSIKDTTFKLFKQGSTTKIAATVSYHPDPDPSSLPYTAKLDPTNSLRSGVTYRAVVTTGAKDLAGNPLAQQHSWFFTVGK